MTIFKPPILKSQQKMHKRVSKKGKIFYAGNDAEKQEEKTEVKLNLQPAPPKFKKGDRVIYNGKKGTIDIANKTLLGYPEYAINFDDDTRKWVTREETIKKENPFPDLEEMGPKRQNALIGKFKNPGRVTPFNRKRS